MKKAILKALGAWLALLPLSAAATPAHLSPIIQRVARQEGVDPRLIEAVIQAESNFDARARSAKGAMGLMQLMPDTARMLGVNHPYDPEENIQGGARYLRTLLERFSSNLKLALAAYNAGPTTVDQYGGVPPYPETQGYVKKIMANYSGHPLQGGSAALVRVKTTGMDGRGAPIYRYRDANGTLVLTDIPPPKGRGATGVSRMAPPSTGMIQIHRVERADARVTTLTNPPRIVPDIPPLAPGLPPLPVVTLTPPAAPKATQLVADARIPPSDDGAITIRIAGARY